ncbi:hypothetical protein CpecA_0545 [Chlamydia pecorum IPTaLE]|nr:hypothetical protein CpecA_0545 [Chlamydia pecorum IPTaLE]
MAEVALTFCIQRVKFKGRVFALMQALVFSSFLINRH